MDYSLQYLRFTDVFTIAIVLDCYVPVRDSVHTELALKMINMRLDKKPK